MQIIYRKLFEVKIHHDYFLFLLPSGGATLGENYNVADLFDIVPSKETARLMRNQRIVFRTTPQGFSLLAEAEKLSGSAFFITKINLKEHHKFTFHWFLKDAYFPNFTNQRIVENSNNIYYFNNRETSVHGGILYLNKGIVPFGTTYFNEPAYRLGDLIRRTTKTYELAEKEASKTNFPSGKWQQVNTAIIDYVNPSSRIQWQFPRFEHKRSNSTPGELITYTLKDIDGQPISLGQIPGTFTPQNLYTASANAAEPVNHTLDFNNVESGKYTLEINETAGLSTREFYLLDPLRLPDVFGVSEFFVSGAATQFQFISKDIPTQRWVLDDPHKTFMIRFKNRLTNWNYLKQDETLFHQPVDLRPLSKYYTGYKLTISGTPTNMPDPDVHIIHPDIDAPTKLVKNIYSKIYLTN